MACRRFNLFTYAIEQLQALQSNIRRKVLARIGELELEFELGCPTPEQLERILKERDNLLNFLKKVQRKVIRFEEFAEKVRLAAEAAVLAIQGVELYLTFNPLPQPTATFYPLLKIIQEYGAEMKAVLDEICDFERVAKELKEAVNLAIDKIENLDILLAGCTDKLTPANLSKYVEASILEVEYKEYRIVIENNPSSPPIAPKRFAVAYNRNNIAVIKGPSSFSSDTQVLIEEVKFRIDNQLP
jgi:hypothetical protein